MRNIFQRFQKNVQLFVAFVCLFWQLVFKRIFLYISTHKTLDIIIRTKLFITLCLKLMLFASLVLYSTNIKMNVHLTSNLFNVSNSIMADSQVVVSLCVRIQLALSKMNLLQAKSSSSFFSGDSGHKRDDN